MLRWTTVPILAAALLAGPCSRPVLAQAWSGTPPRTRTITDFGPFYDGEYLDALKGFESESRSSIKTVQSRWIDSICYETMCGECYFQMGRLDAALQRYTNALELYRRFPDWMIKVQFSSPTIRPAFAGARKAVPWGQSSRHSILGSYPASEKILQGQIDMSSVVQQGGVLSPANFFPITPHEIVRCTALGLAAAGGAVGAAVQVRSTEQ